MSTPNQIGLCSSQWNTEAEMPSSQDTADSQVVDTPEQPTVERRTTRRRRQGPREGAPLPSTATKPSVGAPSVPCFETTRAANPSGVGPNAVYDGQTLADAQGATQMPTSSARKAVIVIKAGAHQAASLPGFSPNTVEQTLAAAQRTTQKMEVPGASAAALKPVIDNSLESLRQRKAAQDQAIRDAEEKCQLMHELELGAVRLSVLKSYMATWM